MDQFPRKPLFDRVIVREIPIKDIYQQSEVPIPLDDARIKDRSDRGIVMAVGQQVQEVQVGDTVFFDEFCLCDPVYLNPADKRRSDLPKYWQMREADLKGISTVNITFAGQLISVDETRIQTRHVINA
jgi:co-chaperonin GroES (HSP10)